MNPILNSPGLEYNGLRKGKPMMIQKQCSKCHQFKNLSNFSSVRKGRVCYESRCKACHINQTKEWQKRNMNRTSLIAPKIKRCTRCKKTKEAKEFAINKRTKDGLNYYCKICLYEMDRRNLIDFQTYQTIYRRQKGLCAICNKSSPTKKFCVDHDHCSGKIRKLLCDRCNLALGGVEYFYKNRLLKATITYLKSKNDCINPRPSSKITVRRSKGFPKT